VSVVDDLRSFLVSDGRLCVVKAPPGSGKSFNLVRSLAAVVDSELRVVVAAQTNNQVDDLCEQIATAYPQADIVRFSSSRYRGELPPNVFVTSDRTALPDGASIVVGTVSKWAITDDDQSYDMVFIDEAWQMTWADLLTLRDVAARFVLIGDPGQIPPVVSVDVDRWEVSPVAPHRPAPDVILSNPELQAVTTELFLDTCWRLPHDSVELVRGFYDFAFDPVAAPGERFLRPTKSLDLESPVDRAVRAIDRSSTVVLAHPSDMSGAVVDPDSDLAELVARLAERLIELRCVYASEPGERDDPRSLTPDDIGITSTHNLMNSAIERALPSHLRGSGGIRVTTPERWQGLQRPVMIAVHPLSGVLVPSSFDLETGRLCVMASRHRSACFFVTRDGVGHTLDTHLPAADQALGRDDVVGRGHAQHTKFWKYHEDHGLVVR
jgi:hypothetical protein